MKTQQTFFGLQSLCKVSGNYFVPCNYRYWRVTMYELWIVIIIFFSYLHLYILYIHLFIFVYYNLLCMYIFMYELWIIIIIFLFIYLHLYILYNVHTFIYFHILHYVFIICTFPKFGLPYILKRDSETLTSSNTDQFS